MKKILKRITGVLLSISISLSTNFIGVTAATQQQFKDVKSTDWYYASVTKLVELNITSGAGNGMYKPNNSVTRAEFVTFICRALGLQPARNNPFVDTKKHWADGYITIALANNMISLPVNKKFRPNDAITRAETVEIMCRALNVQPDNTLKTPYTDVKANTGYINAAYSNYLMQGSIVKGQRYFYPNNKLTRGEVAKIIVNAYDYSKDKMAFLNKAMDEEQIPYPEEYIYTHGNLDFIPSSIHLSVVEANLRMEMGSEKLLANILEPLRKDYDYILIDTNPSLGPLTINALSAADSVIIPINPEYYATMGLTDLTKTILKIRKRINPKIQFEGILLTMCDMQTNLHREVCEEVIEAYRNGIKIFKVHISMGINVFLWIWKLFLIHSLVHDISDCGCYFSILICK
jgi:chromosome partitioning protein